MKKKKKKRRKDEGAPQSLFPSSSIYWAPLYESDLDQFFSEGGANQALIGSWQSVKSGRGRSGSHEKAPLLYYRPLWRTVYTAAGPPHRRKRVGGGGRERPAGLRINPAEGGPDVEQSLTDHRSGNICGEEEEICFLPFVLYNIFCDDERDEQQQRRKSHSNGSPDWNNFVYHNDRKQEPNLHD